MTPLKTPSRLIRSLSAAAALMTTLLVLSSVVGLALHYEHGASLQAAVGSPLATGATRAA